MSSEVLAQVSQKSGATDKNRVSGKHGGGVAVYFLGDSKRPRGHVEMEK